MNKQQAVAHGQHWSLANERSILAELDHPFVIKYVRSFRGTKFVYFLQELMTGGELLDALDALGLLNEEQVQFYAGSIILALEYLHERRIAFLDLKGENCLVDQHGYLKIIDFGVAERIKSGRCHAVKGTPLFMAPEVILGKGYTTTADLWSLGVCLYDFMLGEFPFSNDSASQASIFRAVLKAPLKFPQWFKGNKKAQELITGLLTRDPSQRLGARVHGFTDVKEHSFFSSFSWSDLLGRSMPVPFVPEGEVYAEDQEDSRGQVDSENPRCTLDEGAEDDSTNGEWRSVDIGWDAEFEE